MKLVVDMLCWVDSDLDTKLFVTWRPFSALTSFASSMFQQKGCLLEKQTNNNTSCFKLQPVFYKVFQTHIVCPPFHYLNLEVNFEPGFTFDLLTLWPLTFYLARGVLWERLCECLLYKLIQPSPRGYECLGPGGGDIYCLSWPVYIHISIFR